MAISKHVPEELGVFDLETTGVDVYGDAIVTAFIGLMDREGNLIERHEWLVDPGREIPTGASDIHGVTTEKAQAEGMDSKKAVFQIMQRLDIYDRKSIPIAGYNLAYDLTLLRTEAERHGYRFVAPRTIIDAFVIDKKLNPFRKGKRTLSVITPLYGVELGDAHNAEADCVMAGRVALKQLDKINLPVQEVHKRSIQYAKEQAASLEQYLRRTDDSIRIDGTWPVRAPKEGAE
jgi:DNA polymerase-3 subunit epsilon